MKVYELQPASGLDFLSLVDRPTPEPKQGEVLVQIKATSLNYRDLMVAKGAYGKGGPATVTPLSDGAGEVVAIGEGVTQFKVGDRVAGTFMQSWLAGPVKESYGASAMGGAIDGVLAEYRVFPQGGLVHIPSYLSYEEAAALPCAAVTVWNAMFESGNVKPGQTILLQGTGGVSLFALQFAKAAGLRTILTSSSNDKLARGREMGADETINYRETPEWARETKKLTDGEGVDHIIEVGGAGTFTQSLHATKTGGTISMIGVLTGVSAEIPTAMILSKSLRIDGIYVGSQAMFQNLNAFLSAREIHPVVDKVFDFDQARAAYDHLASGAHFGKVVIRI